MFRVRVLHQLPYCVSFHVRRSVSLRSSELRTRVTRELFMLQIKTSCQQITPVIRLSNCHRSLIWMLRSEVDPIAARASATPVPAVRSALTATQNPYHLEQSLPEAFRRRRNLLHLAQS